MKADEREPFANLKEGMQELRSIQPELIPTTVTPKEWVNCDADVKISAAIAVEEIIRECQKTHDADANSDEDSEDDFEVYDGHDAVVFPLSGKH